MSPTVEFGSKDAADAAREQWGEHLCPDDDRRLKTVAFVEDVPDRVIERAELEAATQIRLLNPLKQAERATTLVFQSRSIRPPSSWWSV
ncbi:hypothetical protein [Halapricum hydrolyticum]|uniref:Uncharacterized protein n=1 Tax=Halapricum hydrolyticum TaxID=2979991 RepID=A0AAE3LDN7_9EURY|nr:hypothetical protein [Halapricum hydrolyticum]MCU4716993.1 hypothetical protein [Halapricum hydrolyticum]MCU4725401.1 hypothetical protein [Halapricum hydrolyticum]